MTGCLAMLGFFGLLVCGGAWMVISDWWHFSKDLVELRSFTLDSVEQHGKELESSRAQLSRLAFRVAELEDERAQLEAEANALEGRILEIELCDPRCQ